MCLELTAEDTQALASAWPSLNSLSTITYYEAMSVAVLPDIAQHLRKLSYLYVGSLRFHAGDDTTALDAAPDLQHPLRSLTMDYLNRSHEMESWLPLARKIWRLFPHLENFHCGAFRDHE